jgi:hypothetical protein
MRRQIREQLGPFFVFMKLPIRLARLLSWATLASLGPTLLSASALTLPGDPLAGSGKVTRSVLRYGELTANSTPAAPVDDSAGFALPANAAAPAGTFEGTLTLSNPGSSGGFRLLRDEEKMDTGADSPRRHLATFSFQFVQNGSYLIPGQQGLVITGSPAWNYIVGPGRVWREDGDHDYTRASIPFALVERSQNCVHNGEMTFLFSNKKTPSVSQVRYQITQETCDYFKFNMWGQLPATYVRGKVARASELRMAAAAEMANRLPTKPFSALATDYPNSGLDLANFTSGRKFPEDVTTYGLFINGVHYVGNCQTRYGMYAFCDQLRMPSYSVAKSAFAGLALIWLGQQYGSSVYRELIRNYVPQYVVGGDWTNVTFANTSDMATGNYISTKEEEDEDSPQENAFIDAEPYAEKIKDAFAPFPHKANPGATFVYQSSATFILTQAMNSYLQRREGSGADIFNSIRDTIYKPIHLSQGGLSTLRTDNSATGRPYGGWGLFFIQDDVAKIGRLLNNSGGMIDGKQALEPTRLRESLFRTADPAGVGLPVPWSETPTVQNTYRYHNYFWARHMTPVEFPQYHCDFWVPLMSGYGGNSVLLLPNGATFYIFSDGDEWEWFGAVNEINKIAPFCK